MEQIENKDSELLKVPDEDLFINNFKSMYYRMNAKPDSMTKIFSKEVIVGIDDIKELNSTIVSKLRNHYYKDAGFMINVIVNFKNRKSLSFSNWKEFDRHNWVESNSINSITITWDFNITLPNYNNPQRHTLTVKLSNGMRPEEMLNIIFSGNIEDLDEANMNKDFFPIVARVDFIDQVLGDELLNLVLNWCEGLRNSENQQNKLILFFQKHKRKISYMVNYIILFVIFVLGIALIDHNINTYNISLISEMSKAQLINFVNTLIIFTLVCIFANKFFGIVANNLFGQLQEYGDNHLFNITKGDKNRQEAIKHKNKSKSIGILVKVIGTFLLDILCSIVSGYLLKK